ncbi:zinc-dependent metalloprotease [Pseudoalteromonas sp. SG45-5]|uniref:zinc-dependent metalloprotease n=1 Tax=unclassified Pseudoalteromonas TaxID=194690 RepID=UPI0015F78792|nr:MULTISPECIES: zinc-dependent metalloprotease [unclassified Pseudoalteromonas]MBB1384578.1 zinc-dependent metalloprotease [Pseudoalteromonas sp. SG45-5]MBB1394451.1 zinc-dependent metalloprotease [Pseudoalteromonas sp. SG44-4]MBB1446596.1 zinc-dependent metalloprotease [Pseudoalteromonas sp. SG41-6]
MKLTTITLALSLALSGHAFAAEKKEDKEPKTLSEMIKGQTEFAGVFNLYQDGKTGEHLMVISESQLDTPFVYFAHTIDGVTDAGHYRGAYRETKLIEFRKYFDRIDIISKTPRYKFDENSAISKASEANISEAVLASIKIEKEEDGKIAFNVNKLFLSEALHKVSPTPNPADKNAKKRFKVGKLDDKKSRIIKQRPYPNNLDVVVDYVFTNASPTVRGSNAVSDPRSVSLKVQHSFVSLPNNNYAPRMDDARIGYFTNQFDQMTSTDWAPYQDVIKRWDLQKKDAGAALSEPVKPITWWIENTTPVEWRDTIRDAVLTWNTSFEKAGFKNALEVKVQPDDADWDAGDINYNVLRWTSSPKPPFGGYGPALANPLTGEILGSDIMLEFVFMKNRWIYDTLFTQGTMSHGETMSTGELNCSLGHEIQQNLMLAKGLASGDKIADKEMLRQGLTQLVLHEVGHTLGLNHNMKSSILWDEKEVHDKNKTQGIVTGSVMDYAPANIAPIGMQQGDIFQTKPGPYDDWAINYGYSVALADKAAEQARLDKILARSSEHALAFGNDADDMRAPGRHIDPRVMIGDLSSNPAAYGADRMALINKLFTELKDKATVKGESYQQLVTSANSLFGQYRAQAGVVSRQIGGVYVERAVVGDANADKPFTPVSLERQTQAMDILAKFVFAPDVLQNMQPLYSYLQLQRRGFNHYGKNEDPKAHQMILGMQKSVLAQLLHPAVLLRISDTALYGNEYSLTQFMQDLTASIFVKSKDANSISHNLQIEYVNQLIAIAGLGKASKFDNLAKTAALYQLTQIADTSVAWGSDTATKAHKKYIDRLIAKALEA